MATNGEIFQFQAEAKQLLEIMIHSLYTNKEIFLRELISNASDALDRLRFEALTKPELLGNDEKLEIRLESDPKAKTLTIYDNGIGMSREDLIANIGTIAKSGTRELREKIKEGSSNKELAQLIGQFGVGFYACFMVADKVSIISQRAGETAATKWESSGDGTYVITEADQAKRGTAIKLHLKPADPENGIEDFTDKWVIARIIKQFSDFVNYPIVFKDQREEVERDETGEPKKDGKTTTIIEDKILNSMKPIWTRPPSEVTEEAYNEFYKQIAHDLDAPLVTIPLKAEGRIEYQALLFIPSKAPYDLYYHAAESGVRLYAKRVMIMEHCSELLPSYLRFIKGVVDSADLPLNISRQMLQEDRHIIHIRKWLVKKVLDTLTDLHTNNYSKYAEFWIQFGRTLKEGVSSDYDNKDKIVSLLLFQSSDDPEKLTTLRAYADRMKDGQNEIFYLTGDSRGVVENSPHLEAFKEKGWEVLYLVEPVDELLVQYLIDFEGKRLKSVGKGTVELASNEEKEKAENEIKAQEKEYAKLLEFLQEKLNDQIKQVRLSKRLTKSPVCLVVAEHDYSPQLERLLQKGKGGGPKQRRIMELNPKHPIFIKLHERFQRNETDPIIGEYAELLLGYALLSEGSELPNPTQFNRLVADLMIRVL